VAWIYTILSLGLGHADAQTEPVRKVVHWYALTSANDFAQRDPQDWRLLASNDGGRTWTTLDERKGEVFPSRQERKLYEIPNTNAFETYRWQIDKVRDADAVNSVQLAELEVMGVRQEDHSPQPVFTDSISARGENPPMETVLNLFDGRVETKWLDWIRNGSAKQSWIQWQYLAPGATVITNLKQLLALRARAQNGYSVRVDAVVVGRTANGARTCVLDSSGCIELSGLSGMDTLAIGQRVSIAGTSIRNGQRVDLTNGIATVTGPTAASNPIRIGPQNSFMPEQDMEWVEITGEIQYPRVIDTEMVFDLTAGNLRLRGHLRDPDNSPVLPPSGTRVVARGICTGAFNQSGRWEAANLWMAGADTIGILDSRNQGRRPSPTEKQPTDSAILTSNKQVRDLSHRQLEGRPPVRIRGVITELHAEYIQDDTCGIRLVFPVEQTRKTAKFGTYIEVEGTAGLDENDSPLISADRIQVLGPGKLPPSQELSLSQLMTGQIDAQWIEVQGSVRSTDGAHLLLICDGQELTATLGMGSTRWVNGLVDAEIRVRGVGVAARDDQGRVQGIHLLIPTPEQVDVLQPAPDPATLPVRKIGSLLGMSGPREFFHRVKVEGVVSLQDNRKVFLQDDTGSAMAFFKEDVVLDARFGRSHWLYWRKPEADAVASAHETFLPGDRVQAVGFPETHRYSPVLAQVILAKRGANQPLAPVELTANGMEEGGLDSRLVTLEGVLRGRNNIGANTVLALEWQDRTLQIFVPAAESDSSKIAIGSRLRVTGVCEVDPAPYAELGLGVGAIRIQTRTARDLVVLARPSWWTVERALVLVGGMLFVIIAAFIWIKQLHRQVQEQTAKLGTEIQHRERIEHHRAMEQERARIAKDLHDDLGANLTQIVFLSQRVEVARDDNHDRSRWFSLIPATARRTIQSLDEIVWAINPQHDSLESLANYLSQFAQEHLSLAQIRCLLDIPTVLPDLPLGAEIRHNLLLTVREALQNTVTHASATEVNLKLNLAEDALNIAIADNGRGFDLARVAQNGNGLANMRHRLLAIGGQLEIKSKIHEGTVIRLVLPMEALHGRVIGVANREP
jgi:signal transduction histidine kinase